MYFASEDFEAEAGKTPYENMVNSLAEKGNKEFTANGKNWSATRQDDSVVSQLIADHNTDSVLENAARDASYQEMKKNLQASRVLDYVENSHGIQKDMYQVTKAEDGRHAGTRPKGGNQR
ncbi:hypothetical protein [Undibacterium sp. TC9W]|uniref:hypothetical protein n=1 Tax=Undibacterium sp. TC9W TaxID=3413053 RepID=UPI003BF1B1D4